MDWKSIINTVAPLLGTAIGGPVGGIAVKAITSALGLDDGASNKEIDAALKNATPDQLAAIKRAEADFKVQMKKLDIDLEAIHQQDRDSARKREMATGDKIPAVLAITTMLAFFGYIGGVTFFPAATMDIAFINIAVGWLGGTASTVIAYYFGSSSGQDKQIGMQK
jgi:hypothetical protein